MGTSVFVNMHACVYSVYASLARIKALPSACMQPLYVCNSNEHICMHTTCMNCMHAQIFGGNKCQSKVSEIYTFWDSTRTNREKCNFKTSGWKFAFMDCLDHFEDLEDELFFLSGVVIRSFLMLRGINPGYEFA